MDNTFKYILDKLLDQTRQRYRRKPSVEINPDETGFTIISTLPDGTRTSSIRAQVEPTIARGSSEYIVVVIGTDQKRIVFWPVKGTLEPRHRKAVGHIEQVVYKAYGESLAIRQVHHKNLAQQEIGDIPSDLRLERITDDYYELGLFREPLTKNQAKMLFSLIMEIRKNKR